MANSARHPSTIEPLRIESKHIKIPKCKEKELVKDMLLLNDLKARKGTIIYVMTSVS